MHTHNLNDWQHQHQFHPQNRQAERNTHRVMLLTLVMMVGEIIAGWLFGSMALLADGWHMGTHFFALGITAFAYWYSRKHADDGSYSFGTGKVGVLGGYTSAIVLALVAALMVIESFERLLSPATILFNQALLVAVIGLIVNLVSAVMLHDGSHGPQHAHGHHHDHNLKAAYLHVIADALTSLLAIIALLAGKHMGWVWLDPLIGIIGAVVITVWAWGLLKDTGQILLDRHTDEPMRQKIFQLIEAEADNRIADLHLRQLSIDTLAGEITIVTHRPQSPEHYKNILQEIKQLRHITIEVHSCPGDSCIFIPKTSAPDLVMAKDQISAS